MRTILTMLLLLSAFISSFGQETKKTKIETEEPKTTEVFYILKDHPEIKQGKYTKTYAGRLELIEHGQFENNIKVGIWEYLGNGELEQRIDYTSNEVIFSKPFRFTKTMIFDGQNLIENNTGDTPILLGGNSKLSYYLVKYLRYPAQARRMGTQGTVIISGTVTKDGKFVDEKVEQGLENGLSEEALRIIEMLPDDWIPLKVNGEPVETRVFIPVKFKLA